MDPMKETFSFEEAMKSPCREEFIAAMKKEVTNHAKRKHSTYCRKNDVPVSEIL